MLVDGFEEPHPKDDEQTYEGGESGDEMKEQELQRSFDEPFPMRLPA